jgi:hypothetical protein
MMETKGSEDRFDLSKLITAALFAAKSSPLMLYINMASLPGRYAATSAPTIIGK